MSETTSCNQAGAAIQVADEARPSGVLDAVVALAYGAFFLLLAVSGSLWILADLTATLASVPRVH